MELSYQQFKQSQSDLPIKVVLTTVDLIVIMDLNKQKYKWEVFLIALYAVQKWMVIVSILMW